MTDHDWDGDGGAGGSARPIGGTAAGEPGAEASGSRSANVVPFPGNWFGSVDDLVPVHPEPESPALRAGSSVSVAPSIPQAWAPRVAALPPIPEPPAGAAADASAFWAGEAFASDSPAITGPDSAGITGPEVPGVTAPDSPGVLADEEGEPSDTEVALAIESEEAAPSHRRRWAPLLAATLAMAAGGALLVERVLPAATTPTARHHGGVARHGQDTPRGLTQTVTSPVTVTTTVEARGHRRRSPAASRYKLAGRGASSATAELAADHRADTAAAQQTPVSGQRSSSAQRASNSGPRAGGGTSAASSTPPATTNRTSGTARPTSGCSTQSPDSGCLPNG
ncbi:MAG: hypothetical protein KGL16_14465 [Acidobacteriota bacterium]|nr:hypothetical protein [Acidobacteriota bacterium]